MWLDGRDFKNSPPTATWLDRTALGGTGTPTGLAYSTTSGSDTVEGVSLDGVNDSIQLTNSIPDNTSFSLEYTITNPRRLITKTEIMIDTYDGTNTTGFGLIRRTTGIEISSRGVATVIYLIPFATYSTQDLLSITVVVDFITGKFKVYKDGVFLYESASAYFVHFKPLRISESNQALYSGDTIASVKLYNRILTATEVAQNFTYEVYKITRTTVVSDSFNRADNAVMGNADTGQAWSNAVGTWGIAGNMAKCTTPTDISCAVLETGKSNVMVSVNSVFSGYSGICFRYLNLSNTWMVRLNPTSLGLFKYDNSTGATSMGTTALTPVNGTTYNIKVVANGSRIDVYMDGILRISVTDSLHLTRTMCGLYAFNTMTVFEDFKVRALS